MKYFMKIGDGDVEVVPANKAGELPGPLSELATPHYIFELELYADPVPKLEIKTKKNRFGELYDTEIEGEII